MGALTLLAACGGGGGGDGAATIPPPTVTGALSYVPGQFLASSTFANRCAAPRSGTDPISQQKYPDLKGTVTDENNFLRSWTNELYLWYSEVPDLNPASYATPDYFKLLKTSATTASGSPKDKFHFTYATSTWESLSQSGVTLGYGVRFQVLHSTVPRNVVVAFVEATASGAAATLARGATVQAIDGVDIDTTDQGGISTLNAGLTPSTNGEMHTFTIQDLNATMTRQVMLTAAPVTEDPVPVVNTLPGNVGYILFTDHIAPSEQELVTAFAGFKQRGVTDLVLDIRYNGGGYLDIASEVAYMIAGSAQTAGRTFELTQFNDKYPSTDPVTGEPITPMPFHSTTQGLSTTSGQALPALNLMRVFVLTGPGTCSASESIINSLRGINVQVIQVGSTTCGKPYGFYPQDNCGTTYFSIQFRGVNNQGFGDYPDGFSPANTVQTEGVSIPGCSVADDFSHALGDPNEALLNVALSYASTSSCSVPPSGSSAPTGIKRMLRPSPELSARPAFLENRILRRP